MTSSLHRSRLGSSGPAPDNSSWRGQLTRKKTIEQSISETEEPEFQLKRELTTFDLIVFGVAVVIGAGIFTMTARVAGDITGPSIVISFLLAAITCGFAAMCYAEFASTVPVAGSAYTFSFAAFGEFVAWIIGWDLFLEFAVAAAVVARAWSSYLAGLFGGAFDTIVSVGGVKVDLGAIGLVLALGFLLARGTKLSSRVSIVITAIKVAVVLFVIVVGSFYIKTSNYHPFIPPAQASAGSDEGLLKQTILSAVAGFNSPNFGVVGMLFGASAVFFAFVGFDVVASAAEEVRNPQKALPRGIIGSLVIVTILYIGVALVLTGMVKYDVLSTGADGHSRTLATAFAAHGLTWASTIINVGALAGLTTVVMVMLLGQTRVVFAMSRDGLLPQNLAQTSIHGTPSRITWIATILIAIIAGVVPSDDLGDMVNIGTLFAFLLVALGIPYLRKHNPNSHIAFRVPGVPAVPVISAVCSAALMLNLTLETWLRFVVWMLIGLVIYFLYSRRHSVMNPSSEAFRKHNMEGRNSVSRLSDGGVAG